MAGRAAARRVAVALALALLAGCGGSTSDGTSARRRTGSTTTTTVAAAVTVARGDEAADRAAVSGPTTTGAPGSTVVRPAATVVPAPLVATSAAPSSGAGSTKPAPPDADADDSLDGFASSPRSAPAGADGTALLRAVRVGHHDGFDRVVFEFAGDVRPGYRVGWATGPTYADGSGEVVTVAGGATLEVVLQPASGVDMETGKPVYRGPDRVPAARSDGVLRELVRTGDFEAVLSWAVGTDRERPFRVHTLAGPPRVVVDVRAP
ncbi:hypothetical protein KSP35_01615 [Aquihabitans sp. G128]|uniref:AMIN-like domain-containing (lipo)protein n=1 Tax=Aquihabitans sp. G128 TaxID=2849779 RepID=UPI001C23CA69|nr:hypothetical protein [Aquihabitans sp. G128]QXC61573.1 hypothetical protein KSP35_01615 [Aquihabitans sp. G128]